MCHKQHLNQRHIPWSGNILHHHRGQNSSSCFSLLRSYGQCFRSNKEFAYGPFCFKVSKSTQLSIVKILRNWNKTCALFTVLIIHCTDSWQYPFTHCHKNATSCHNLQLGTIRTSYPLAYISHQAIFACYYIWKPYLHTDNEVKLALKHVIWRRRIFIMKHKIHSIKTLVLQWQLAQQWWKLLSKNSVRNVYKIGIQWFCMFLFFLSSPSKLNLDCINCLVST